MSALISLIEHHSRGSSQIDIARKRNLNMHIGKKEIRQSLFLGDMIVYIQGMQEVRF